MSVDRSYRFKNKWRTTEKAELFRRDGGCYLCHDQGSDGHGKGLNQAHLIPAGPGVPDATTSQRVLLCATCHRKFDSGRKRQ